MYRPASFDVPISRNQACCDCLRSFRLALCQACFFVSRPPQYGHARTPEPSSLRIEVSVHLVRISCSRSLCRSASALIVDERSKGQTLSTRSLLTQVCSTQRASASGSSGRSLIRVLNGWMDENRGEASCHLEKANDEPPDVEMELPSCARKVGATVQVSHRQWRLGIRRYSGKSAVVAECESTQLWPHLEAILG